MRPLYMVGYILSRGGAVAARRAHNPEVAGSNPAPATKSELIAESIGYFSSWFLLN